MGKYFPSVYAELQDLGYVRRYTGIVDFLVYSKYYGFINCEELGRIHFTRSSLINPNIWVKLKSGTVVNFGAIIPQREDSLPHAVRLDAQDL